MLWANFRNSRELIKWSWFFFIYLAKKLEKCEDKKEDYQIEIQEIDFDEVYKMVLNNEIVDGKTSLGVLLCKDIIN